MSERLKPDRSLFHASAPPLRGSGGIVLEGGIAAIELAAIGSTTQWISIRCHDSHAPVLLFLHGGPGLAEMPLIRKHFAGLIESRFVVAAWDQRGAGKSYHAASPGTLTVERLLADTCEVVDYLRSRFQRDRVFILGHSWGSALGTLFAAQHPERVEGYGGIGQFVSGRRNEALAYAWTLEQARIRNNRRAARELEEIAWYPEEPLRTNRWFSALRTERKWIAKFGGALFGHRSQYLAFLGDYLGAPEYSLRDKVNVARGLIDSLPALWPEMIRIDLIATAPRLRVPIVFFEGRHDYTTPWPLAREYFESLDAPSKELVWFDTSAHSPHLEQPEAFAKELVRTFLGPRV